MIDPADYRLSVDGAAEVCHRQTAEMLRGEHERALEERNRAQVANMVLLQAAGELGRIDRLVTAYQPWTAGCETVPEKVHAVLLRLQLLENGGVTK